MRKKWLTYDLQFFADEGGEESVDAEQTEVDESEEPEESGDEGEDEQPEEEDRDSIYAAARRRAESEARARYEKEQQERDAYYAKLCEGRLNPETNKPITTEAEYREAMSAMQRVSAMNELQEKGVDPNVIERYIANSPEIQQSKRMLAEMQDREAKEQLDKDIQTIMSLDRSYESKEDLMQSEAFQSAVGLCNQLPGLRIQDAYKIVNFEALRDAGVKAAKQAAVNEAKGKDHLKTTPNTPAGNGSVEIPEAEFAKWKRFYPDKSRKELNALYAKVHSKGE